MKKLIGARLIACAAIQGPDNDGDSKLLFMRISIYSR